MKINRLIGERFREDPSDCVLKSHALMIRGGYMKYVANGIYSSFTPLIRVMRKIEGIIRQEMDRIGGSEVQMPVVLPASLWESSGRLNLVGSELLKFIDRNEKPHVLGMTHEEAAVDLVCEYGSSYLKYPFMIYQFQTKFRDEARPRGGLIRVREFIMKDAYSFHTSDEDLKAHYKTCLLAYDRIFKKAGLKGVMIVESDAGMMGGDISHEFILPSLAGEDRIAVCSNCDYRANADTAKSIKIKNAVKDNNELTLMSTPEVTTIDALCAFFGKDKKDMCKAVIYQKEADEGYVVLFIRGDQEANETKIRNYLLDEIRPAVIDEKSILSAGYTGPYDLKPDVKVLFDDSLEGETGLVCGANIPGHHYTGLDIKRDCGDVAFHDFAKISEDSICPGCEKSCITITRGIEVGNIFQLGDKYTKAMGMQYTDIEGKLKYPLMGCYGIGIGRLAASVCEQSHDEYGPVWPVSIAPWQVHICCLRVDDAHIREHADLLYDQLQDAGIETIYDDRNISAGVMFADADLLGVPIRIVISPRNIKDMKCEITTRDKSYKELIPIGDAKQTVSGLISNLLDITSQDGCPGNSV